MSDYIYLLIRLFCTNFAVFIIWAKHAI